MRNTLLICWMEPNKGSHQFHVKWNQGIDKRGKRLGPFYSDTVLSAASHFIFSNTVCITSLRSTLRTYRLLHCFHTGAYIQCVSGRIDKHTVQQIVWLTFLNFTSLSDGPGCKVQEAQLLLCSSRWSETCGTEESGHQRSFADRPRGLVKFNCSKAGNYAHNSTQITFKDVKQIMYQWRLCALKACIMNSDCLWNKRGKILVRHSRRQTHATISWNQLTHIACVIHHISQVVISKSVKYPPKFCRG